MSAPTIAEILKFANLQMAAEALYTFDSGLKGSESFDFLKTADTTMQDEKRNDSDPFGRRSAAGQAL